MIRSAVLCLVLLGAGLELAGCASEPLPLYRPFSRRAGYSEVQLAPGRFQVTYQGTPGMSDGAAAEFAKLRAAEVAQRLGKPYLRVISLQMGSRAYTDYDPAWYTTESYYDRDGHPHYHQRLLREASYDTYGVPVAVMTVDLLDGPAPDAFSTLELWQQAAESGLVTPPMPAATGPATQP
jgi:hypothetical protein